MLSLHTGHRSISACPPSFLSLSVCSLSFLYYIFPLGVFLCGFSSMRVSHMFRMSSKAHGWVLG